MFKEIHSKENIEMKNFDNKGYREIKPEGSMAKSEIKPFWKNVFEGKFEKAVENLENTLKEYFKDLKEKSEFPDTIDEKASDVSDWKKISPEEKALMREEFDSMRDSLKKQWEEVNGRPWPTHDKDVYITTKKGERIKIKEAGSDYEAHHIQPLGLGGKNEVGNITPLHAEVHFDHRGVHATESPYKKLDKLLGGIK